MAVLLDGVGVLNWFDDPWKAVVILGNSCLVGVLQSFSISDLWYVVFVGVSQIGLCLYSSIWSCGLVHLNSVSVDDRG